MSIEARLAKLERSRGTAGGWHWDEEGHYVPGPDLVPDLTGKLTDHERRLLWAWRLLDAHYTRWMERLDDAERARWAARHFVAQAADEPDLLAGLRILLTDDTITLEAALLAEAPVEDRFVTLLGGNPDASEWVLRIYRTIHPECAALAHLEPIRPCVGCIGLSPNWWEAGA